MEVGLNDFLGFGEDNQIRGKYDHLEDAEWEFLLDNSRFDL